jgi:hypothetical protein
VQSIVGAKLCHLQCQTLMFGAGMFILGGSEQEKKDPLDKVVCLLSIQHIFPLF